MNKNLNIMVVCGGFSTEREISLKSGKSIFDALIKKGYSNTTLFDLTQDNISQIIQSHPDFVFLALHGKGGEDGSIQGLLDLAKIPYTGSGLAASALCMDKILTKRILRDEGLPTPNFLIRNRQQILNSDNIAEDILSEIKTPFVVKSPCQGSSVGVVIVKDASAIQEALNEVLKYGDDVLVEEFVEGSELTLPIVGNEKLTAYPIVEITSEREFYDYKAKYTPGLCHHIIPACIDNNTTLAVEEIGKRAYKLFGCKGFARIDFIVSPENGPMIIEINTLPGMTDMSLFPDAARYIGVCYEDLVEKFMEYGLESRKTIF